MFAKILLCSFFCFSPLVQAGSNACEGRDFRSELPPISSSAGTNWCFAYSAADLVTQKLKTPVSAVDIAYGYVEQEEQSENEGIMGSLSRFFGASRHDLGDLITGGFANKAIMSRAKIGFCREQDLPSTDVTHHEELFKLFQNMRKMVESQGRSCLNSSLMQKQFPGVSKLEGDKIFAHLEKDTVLSTLAKNSCDKRINSSQPLQVEVKVPSQFSNSDEFWKQLDSNLSSGKMLSVQLQHMLTDPELKKNSAHAVTIVGRRWNVEKKSCEYLVRNSLDQNNCTYFQCEKDGHVWVSESFLKKSVASFTDIK